MSIKRGEIYVAALGHEISKTCPVVVVSNDNNNQYTGTITILPITSQNLKKIYPFEVFVEKGTGSLPKNSKISRSNKNA